MRAKLADELRRDLGKIKMKMKTDLTDPEDIGEI